MRTETADKKSSHLFTHTGVRKMSVADVDEANSLTSVNSGSELKQTGVEWVFVKTIGLAYA